MQDALDLVRGRLEARGVTVEVTAGLPAVDGDRVRLIEVIQNLTDKCGKIRSGLVGAGGSNHPLRKLGQLFVLR